MPVIDTSVRVVEVLRVLRRPNAALHLTSGASCSGASYSQAIALLLSRLQRPRLVPPRALPPLLTPTRPTPTRSTSGRPTPSPPASAPLTPSHSTPARLPLQTTRSAASPTAVATAQRLPPAPRSEFASAFRPTRDAMSAKAAPTRTWILLAATALASSLLTALTLRQFDATAESSQARVMPSIEAHGLSAFHSPQTQRPEPSGPSSDSLPAHPKPSVEFAPSAPQLAAPKESPANLTTAPPESQEVQPNTPIADPATFGSEAAEPIYSN
jgi:hypothetical protein